MQSLDRLDGCRLGDDLDAFQLDVIEMEGSVSLQWPLLWLSLSPRSGRSLSEQIDVCEKHESVSHTISRVLLLHTAGSHCCDGFESLSGAHRELCN